MYFSKFSKNVHGLPQTPLGTLLFRLSQTGSSSLLPDRSFLNNRTLVKEPMYSFLVSPTPLEWPLLTQWDILSLLLYFSYSLHLYDFTYIIHSGLLDGLFLRVSLKKGFRCLTWSFHNHISLLRFCFDPTYPYYPEVRCLRCTTVNGRSIFLRC